MIITRYLVRETVKSQLAILFILLMIFFCQKLIRILGATVNGDLPANLVLTLLGLGVSQVIQLILPLSLFLAILLAFGRLYMESEVTAMFACGMSRATLLQAAATLMLLTAAVAAINVIWLTPWSARYQDQVVQNARENPGAATLAAGKFQPSPDGNLVLFIERASGNNFNNVFIAQLRAKGNTSPSVLLADRGTIQQRADGAQMITLNKGTRFEGTAMLRNFRITDFTQYKTVIGFREAATDPNDAAKADFHRLYENRANPAFAAELHWRLTLVFSVFVMGLMVVPLSATDARQRRMATMLPSVLLYLIFFLLQSSLKTNGERGKLDPAVAMWLVNLAYSLLAIGLNVWGSVALGRLRRWCGVRSPS